MVVAAVTRAALCRRAAWPAACPERLMRVLVIGRSGQIATELLARLPAAGHLAEGLEPPEFDLTDPAQVEAAFARFRPEAVINAAAYTAVDRAEDEPALAYAVNAT